MEEPISASPLSPNPLLDFQKATAQLVRAGLITADDSNRLVRTVNRQVKAVSKLRDDLRELVLAILMSVEDDTLRDGREYRRIPQGLAIHIESATGALFRARRSSWGTRDLQRFFKFGVRHFPEVIVARSDRVIFGPDEDRRRAVVLDIEKAWEFVGGRPRSVPVR